MLDITDSWSQVQAQLRQAVGDTAYRLWLDALEPRELDAQTLVVAAPDARRSWIAERFGRVLQTCAAAVLGPEVTVHVVARGKGQAAAGQQPGTDVPALSHDVAPNPKYSFDQFVIGDGNRLAHAAALAVAEQPAQTHNPLFIYGPPGLGKTHLLHSIANYASTHSPGLRVRYATGETFASDFIDALRKGSVELFKQRYRGIDLLLLDDVQFLERKTRTEEEFFHTFNAAYESGAQLVITSDRRPADLDALERRLRERFGSGLIADVEPPNFETRLTILRTRVRQDQLAIADEAVLDLIARRVVCNVRALEGALIRVIAHSSLTHKAITVEHTRRVLNDLAPQSGTAATPTVGQIQQLVCETFALDSADLLSANRSARLAWPRQVAMYLARQLTDNSYAALGRSFGGRNHATVLHGCQQTARRIAEDAEVRALVNNLLERLSSPALVA